MPFGESALLLQRKRFEDDKMRADLEDAFLHTMAANRKLQAQVTLLRNPPPRERFRDHLVAVAKTLLPPAERQYHMDRLDREARSVHEICSLQTQVMSLRERIHKLTLIIETQEMQLQNVHQEMIGKRASKQSDVAEIARLRGLVAERTDQNNNLMAALQRARGETNAPRKDLEYV